MASDVSKGRHTISLGSQGNNAFPLLMNGIVLDPGGIKWSEGYILTGTLEKVWSLEDYRKFVKFVVFFPLVLMSDVPV